MRVQSPLRSCLANLHVPRKNFKGAPVGVSGRIAVSSLRRRKKPSNLKGTYKRLGSTTSHIPYSRSVGWTGYGHLGVVKIHGVYRLLRSGIKFYGTVRRPEMSNRNSDDIFILGLK